MIGQHQVGARQALYGAQGDQARITRTCTDEIRLAKAMRELYHAAVVERSSAPLDGRGFSPRLRPRSRRPLGLQPCAHPEGPGPGGHPARLEWRAARKGRTRAQQSAERQLGLMFSQSLDPGTACCFYFEQPQPFKFWMKNTYIPLDMIFSAARSMSSTSRTTRSRSRDPRGPSVRLAVRGRGSGRLARATRYGPGVEAVEFVDVE